MECINSIPNYGKWSLNQFKAELKKRNAKITGKKADSVQRLYDYDQLFIQAAVEVEDEPYTSITPDPKLNRDINGSHVLNISKGFDIEYFNSIQVYIRNSKGINMYKYKYLLVLRKACNDDGETFLHAKVAAQMKKGVSYKVNVKVTPFKCISDTEYECAAGKGPTAHCKHVVVVFEAIKDFLENKTIKTRPTSTDTLQTFHQAKKYNGSLVKVKDMRFPKLAKLEQKLKNYDPRPVKFTKMSNYKVQFRNQCINFAGFTFRSFPELQLFGPANLFAVYNDHDYRKDHMEVYFMKEMNLYDVSQAKIDRIETMTRGQSNNKFWISEREMRLNSSCFGKICHASPENFQKLSDDLLNPKDLSCVPAICHGKKYELHAIKKFEVITKHPVTEFGTFVSRDFPLLAASPDGIFCGFCVEVKCPYSARDKIISPESVSYLYLCDKEDKLYQDHDYYYQVQGQLYCTGISKCVFIIYTIKDILLLKIYRDQNFIDSMILKLKEFYEKSFKRAIINKYLYRSDSI